MCACVCVSRIVSVSVIAVAGFLTPDAGNKHNRPHNNRHTQNLLLTCNSLLHTPPAFSLSLHFLWHHHLLLFSPHLLFIIPVRSSVSYLISLVCHPPPFLSTVLLPASVCTSSISLLPLLFLISLYLLLSLLLLQYFLPLPSTS